MQFWYPLDNDSLGTITEIHDESGNARHLGAQIPGLDTPIVTANVLNGYKGVVHDDEPDYLLYPDAGLTLRDVYMVAKVDDTLDFDDPFRGLLSGIDNSNYPLLVGKGSTTRWLNNAEGAPSMGWLLDGVLQAEGARTAPFDDFHRIRITTSGAALAMDGIQVGQDRGHLDRLFAGRWTDLMGFSTQRTAAEDRAIALYHDLKFNLWRTNGTLLNFPDPDMTGIHYRRFYEAPERWDDTVVMHKYEDGGVSTNEISDTAIQEWEVEFDCVAARHADAREQYEIFDEFWNAVRTSRVFNFTDKYGETHTGVRIKNYSRAHRGHQSWKNEVAFQLIKYP